MWQSMIMYGLAAISITNAADCSWCKPPDITACGATTSKDWTLVRAIGPTKPSWFNNRDSLQGTDAAVDNNNDQYNIGSFETAVPGFNQYLFATGDCSLFLTTSKDAVGGPINNEYYGDTLRDICSSSEQATHYQARWYNRGAGSEDPWISTIDHHPAIGAGKIVYGQNNFGGSHATNVIPKKGGVYIFIRNAGTLDSNGCAVDPCAGKDCDDGKYCNGEEYCDPKDGECKKGVDVECGINMRCDEEKAKCVRDCDSFAIDEYLTQCSKEFKGNEKDIDDLTSDVFANKQRLDGCDASLTELDNKIEATNLRIDSFGPSTTSSKENAMFVDYNGNNNTTSGYFDGSKDVIIIALLIMNLVTIIVSYCLYSKKNDKKYRVVANQESEDEERAFKR